VEYRSNYQETPSPQIYWRQDGLHLDVKAMVGGERKAPEWVILEFKDHLAHFHAKDARIDPGTGGTGWAAIGDGQIDFPQDTGCKSSADPSERIECADGLDNDGDGKIDTADDGCANAQDDSELPECADGVDNDGDGLTDFPADPGCASNQPFAIERPECSDSLDNDGDGKTDFPADSTCTMASGQRESGLACGLLGIEALIPVVVTLMARRRRAAAARRNS
jgi:hypothetical protein